MANADLASGFKVVQNGVGGIPGRTNEYPLATAYGTALGDGDIVKLISDGSVALAGATDPYIGVFKGVRYVASDGSYVYRKNWIASTAEKSGTTIYAMVEDSPAAVYEVVADTSTSQASVGQFANLVPSAVDANGNSTMSVVHGGSEVQFMITKVITDKPVRNAAGNPDLSATGTFAIVHVRPLMHQLSGNTASEIAEI